MREVQFFFFFFWPCPDQGWNPVLVAKALSPNHWTAREFPETQSFKKYRTWIKKMWHIYSMEYYSAIKRNEIEFFVVRWMNLESVIQSEVSQKEKNKYCMLTHIYGILKKKRF